MKFHTGRFSLIFSLMCLLFAVACASSQKSIEARGNEWIARTLPELKQAMASPASYASKIRWKESTYPLVTGDFVFIEPIEANCSIHWKVRPSGLIFDYQAVGKGCGPQSQAPGASESLEERLTKPTPTW